MAEKLTISQLNKLGERLRKDPDNKDALRLLETFRLSFDPAYDRVFNQLRQFGLNPAGRPAKSTQSIIAKLVRLRTRLSRMQDIVASLVKSLRFILALRLTIFAWSQATDIEQFT